jgi:dipeptidase
MILEKAFPRLLFPAIVIAAITLSASSTERDGGCFSIVVGKNASTDGYVMMAHNEDDTAPQIVNHHKVPRVKYPPGSKVKLDGGAEIEQVEETWACIWAEMPGMLFSDSYINEWGVCITSDVCPSREDFPELTEGGISKMLRRLVAERAKTAREGVRVAAGLVERFGYDATGRTYIISDPDEGWLFCAVGGKHWLAERVPDDEVAMVANTFSVHQVDLSDTNRFLASRDIIEYAVSRGWYDPKSPKPFDFAEVYADPRDASDSSNFCRQWSGLRHVVKDAIPLNEKLPFSVVPEQKLDVAALMQILRDHYEGLQLVRTAADMEHPHEMNINTICNGTTQTSLVVQLRRNMPLDIGIVYWVCLAPPCVSCYIPFHFGIPDFPAGYSGSEEQPSNDFYTKKVEAPFQTNPLEAFWTFSNYCQKMTCSFHDRMEVGKKEMRRIESSALSMQKSVEETVLGYYPSNRALALEMLTKYSSDFYLSATERMATVLMQN